MDAVVWGVEHLPLRWPSAFLPRGEGLRELMVSLQSHSRSLKVLHWLVILVKHLASVVIRWYPFMIPC